MKMNSRKIEERRYLILVEVPYEKPLDSERMIQVEMRI
jgi:hypothetical protein